MMKVNLVSLLCILTTLSSLAYLLKLPAEEVTHTDRKHDPFSLLAPTISSKHRDMMMKLRRLHIAPQCDGGQGCKNKTQYLTACLEPLISNQHSGKDPIGNKFASNFMGYPVLTYDIISHYTIVSPKMSPEYTHVISFIN